MAGSFRAMAGSARRYIGVRNSVLENVFTCGHKFLWTAPKRFGIEILKTRGNGRYHCRLQDMRHVEHDIVRPPALDKGL